MLVLPLSTMLGSRHTVLLVVTFRRVLYEWPCRIIIAHLLLFSSFSSSTSSSLSSHHPSISPLSSLPSPPSSLCMLLSPCYTRLCTINLQTKWIGATDSITLIVDCNPPFFMFHFFPPLFLTRAFYWSIDRHVISYMNNASSQTKIVALLLFFFGWDLFCNSLTECTWTDF